MNFKEFTFDNNIRICIYDIGKENLSFHRHTNISDITYCAKGNLLLELPIINKSFIIPKGAMLQIPSGAIHRVSEYTEHITMSRYILIQLGKFDIKFMNSKIDLEYTERKFLDQKLDIYIGNNRSMLNKIIEKFTKHHFKELTEEENDDILQALTRTMEIALDDPPQNKNLISQLKSL